MGLPVSLRDAFGSVVLCRKCNGRGTLSVRGGGKGRPPIVVEEKPCRSCDGTGLVPAPRGFGSGYPPP